MKFPILLSVFLAAAAASAEDAGGARAELDQVSGEISTLEARRKTDEAAVAKAREALARAERDEAAARKRLRAAEAERREVESRLQELETEADTQRNQLASEREILAAQIRMAYITGDQAWLKLVMSQQDPGELGRQMAWYAYLSEQRSAVVEDVLAKLAGLRDLLGDLEAEQQRLADASAREQARLDEVRQSRAARGEALATVEASMQDTEARLAALLSQKEELQAVVSSLARRPAPAPASGEPFSRQKGALPWPSEGRLSVSFGDARAGGRLKWQGILLEASAGTEVRAVSAGRVVYSDWLPGMGLLTVLDHGEGYLTLYGYNQDLLREVGDRVVAGDAIAHVGDSGGQPRPALYFEVRKDGEPVNPGRWLR